MPTNSSSYVPWSSRPASEYAACLLNIAAQTLPAVLATAKPVKGKGEESVVKEAVRLAACLIEMVDDHVQSC